jgi:hypothetical protein
VRSHIVRGVTVLTMVPSIVWAASDGIPTLDVRPVCRGIASQSADPGVGQRDQTNTFQQCIESEQAVREQLKQEWSKFSAADKRHCVTLATTGGESSNTELLTCLEMARDVRELRAASSAAEAAKPAPSSAAPAAETAKPAPSSAAPAAETAAAVPIPDKVSKAEQSEAKTEIERAKAEAEAAKVSEASAKRKLADAEAALRRAKEEAQRASAEAERAKTDAQNARASEDAVKRKLADAEAAQAKAEQACRAADAARPGFGAQLRKWLGKPEKTNP